ncbi:MAG: hypothetical protein NTW19_02300, partial [Planctomycetota bacterium]|nr:hypothetical protein [Planctomycetota bacterium]
MSFVQWDYPGNKFRDNRALKMRSFVGAAVWMMLFDNFAENNDAKVPPPIRPDWHGYNPVFFAAPYPGFKDLLPPEVQKAYEAGLKKVGLRMLGWGVKGETCENDLLAPLGLVYIAKAINDPEFTKAVEERTKMICADPKYFSPAGYWLERGGIDTGFAGAGNLYAAWIGLMTDWPFAKQAVDRIYRLRAHLVLPEPDGYRLGPSAFNTRLGSPPMVDQLELGKSRELDGARDVAVSFLTDEAACFVSTPGAELLKAAAGRRAYDFNGDIMQNSRTTDPDGTVRYIRNDEIKNAFPWKLRAWMTYNFPISVNPAYEFYKKDAFAHRLELEKKNSPMLKLPVLRGETYLREFDKSFYITRQNGYAAIIHTGPVGAQSVDDGGAQFKGPLGFGGGQISAFWTPTAGSAVLGLRSGVTNGKSYDPLEDWRLWPIHAVSGVTASGQLFSSARIAKPTVEADVKGNAGTVTVSGDIPALKMVSAHQPHDTKPDDFLYDVPLGGKLSYARTFTIDDKGVGVETKVTGDGKETLGELVETIPVFLRDAASQAKAAPTTIEFQVGDAWAPATEAYTEKVSAVRLKRFEGAVVVRFDKPQRAKLSPKEWNDTWFTKAMARNVMVDLLASGDKPAAVKDVRTLKYRFEPAAK